jgi:acyl-CoA thioesterase-2
VTDDDVVGGPERSDADGALYQLAHVDVSSLHAPAAREAAHVAHDGRDSLDALDTLLDLEELDLNLFRGRSPQEDTQRVFGGQVAGQALVAAGRTIEGRRVHSLHAYFLRAGDPRVPIIYQVDRLRDGRSFATRRVTGIQHGRAIFALAASFQIEEESDEHQAEMPETPDPETLPAWEQHIAKMEARGEPIDDWMRRSRPIDTRVVDFMDYAGKLRQEPCQRVWFKADGKLPMIRCSTNASPPMRRT